MNEPELMMAMLEQLRRIADALEMRNELSTDAAEDAERQAHMAWKAATGNKCKCHWCES